MTARVTAAEVKEIISTSLSDSSIDAFITAANLIVTDKLGTNTDLSDAQRKEIERWLAAHLLACGPERQARSEGAGQANITYDGKTDTGLNATLYGQQVTLLDTTGVLVESVGKKQASIYAITSFSDEADV